MMLSSDFCSSAERRRNPEGTLRRYFFIYEPKRKFFSAALSCEWVASRTIGNLIESLFGHTLVDNS
jgi:hypothetical protein